MKKEIEEEKAIDIFVFPSKNIRKNKVRVKNKNKI